MTTNAYRRPIRVRTDPVYDYLNPKILSSLKSHSALPETTLCGLDSEVSDDMAYRALCSAHNLLDEPTPWDIDYEGTKTIGQPRYTTTNNSPEALLSLRNRKTLAASESEREFTELFEHRPRFEHSSTFLDPCPRLSRRLVSIPDPVTDYYLNDSKPEGIRRPAWKNWAFEYPSLNYTHFYRPSYIHSAGVRNASIHPRYI